MPFPEMQNCHPERGRMPESKDPEEDDGLMSLRSIFTTPVLYEEHSWVEQSLT